MDAKTLHEAIAEVCPVDSVRIGDPIVRTTWSFVPGAGATQPQIDAGNNVIATIPIQVPPIIPAGEFISRWTNAEYLLLEKKRRDDVAANRIGIAKNWDQVVMTDGGLDTSKKKVQSLKADLVPDVLTQTRADEIFS